MRTRPLERQRSLAVLLLALASASACTEDAAPAEGEDTPPPAGCSSDGECGRGRICVASVCEDEAVAAACSFEADPICEEGTVCVPAKDPLCPGEGGCLATATCVQVVGELDGAFACGSDEECRSGRCHQGICLSLCRTAEDCDGVACVELTFPRGARASFCLPSDEVGAFDPAHPRCSSDAGCAAGTVCRRRSGDPYSWDAHASCAPEDPALAAAGELCDVGFLLPENTGTPEALAADASCQHGSCEYACLSVAEVCTTPRCTQPCAVSADCPDRTLCLTFARPSASTPLEVRSCFLPLNGCFDDLDCCPATDPAGLCVDGWGDARTYCAWLEQGGRLQTVCGGVPGTVVPGAGCSADGDCASGLCLLPAPAWSAAAPGMCAFVCGPQLDRCPELTGEPAARCTPEPIVVAGEPGSVTVCR